MGLFSNFRFLHDDGKEEEKQNRIQLFGDRNKDPYSKMCEECLCIFDTRDTLIGRGELTETSDQAKYHFFYFKMHHHCDECAEKLFIKQTQSEPTQTCLKAVVQHDEMVNANEDFFSRRRIPLPQVGAGMAGILGASSGFNFNQPQIDRESVERMRIRLGISGHSVQVQEQSACLTAHPIHTPMIIDDGRFNPDLFFQTSFPTPPNPFIQSTPMQPDRFHSLYAAGANVALTNTANTNYADKERQWELEKENYKARIRELERHIKEQEADRPLTPD